MQQKIEDDRLDKENNSEERNPYKIVIINNFGKIKVNINISEVE